MKKSIGVVLVVIVSLAVVLAVGGSVFLARQPQNIAPRAVQETVDKDACTSDLECGCGVDVDSDQCAIQNRNYLSGRCDWPDFCSGITGDCAPGCVDGACQLVCPTGEPPGTFYLTRHPVDDVVMSVSTPNTGYAISAILHNPNGSVVIDQQDYSYNWEISDTSIALIQPFTGCTNGIQPPCPQDHLSITGLIPGITTINVSVLRKSTQTSVASTSFSLQVTESPISYSKFDFNEDGKINLIDYSLFLTALRNYINDGVYE